MLKKVRERKVGFFQDVRVGGRRRAKGRELRDADRARSSLESALVAAASAWWRRWLVTRAPVVASGPSSGVGPREWHTGRKEHAGKHTRNELPLTELEHAAHSLLRSAPEPQPVNGNTKMPGSKSLLVAGRWAIVWVPGALAALAGSVASVGRRRRVASRGPDRRRQHHAREDARDRLALGDLLHLVCPPSRCGFRPAA